MEIKQPRVSKKAERTAEKLKFMNFMNSENASYPSTMATELYKRFDKTCIVKTHDYSKRKSADDIQYLIQLEPLNEEDYHILLDYQTKFDAAVKLVFDDVQANIPQQLAYSQYTMTVTSNGRIVHGLRSYYWRIRLWNRIETCVREYGRCSAIDIEDPYRKIVSGKYSIPMMLDRIAHKYLFTIDDFIWASILTKTKPIFRRHTDNKVVREYNSDRIRLMLSAPNLVFRLSSVKQVNHRVLFPEYETS